VLCPGPAGAVPEASLAERRAPAAPFSLHSRAPRVQRESDERRPSQHEARARTDPVGAQPCWSWRPSPVPQRGGGRQRAARCPRLCYGRTGDGPVLADTVRAGPKGCRGCGAPGPKNQRVSSHWTLVFLFVKSIYSRHKYAKSDALSSYRLVSFILLN
jgi:hypothetical protein